jgi:hypothetical protein
MERFADKIAKPNALEQTLAEIDQEEREAELLVTNYLLDCDQRGFEECNRNPLFAASAWVAARRGRAPLPEWAAQVIDRWAAALTELAEQGDSRVTEDVAQAMGLARYEASAAGSTSTGSGGASTPT